MKYIIKILVFSIISISIHSCQVEDDMVQTDDLGVLTIDIYDFIAGQPETIQAYLDLNANVEWIGNSVELVILDGNGNIVESIGTLSDDGNVVINGDDIEGDRIYSGIIQFQNAQPEVYYLQARVDNGSMVLTSNLIEINVVEDIEDKDLQTIDDVYLDVKEIIEDLVDDGIELEQVRNQTLNWLNSHPSIVSAEYIEGSTMVEINFENELSATLIFVDEENLILGGDDSNRPEPKRKIGGIIETMTGASFRSVNMDAPSNRNVLIYAPYEQQVKDGAVVAEVFKNAECGEYNVTFLRDEHATLDALKTCSNFGTIYITSHGAAGKYFLSGERVTPENITQPKFSAPWKAKKIRPGWEVTFNDGDVEISKRTWLISYKWLEDNLGNLPNSIVFMNACQTTKSAFLYDVFESKGASCFFGYSNTIKAVNAKSWGVSMVKELVDDGLKAGELEAVGNVQAGSGAVLQRKISGSENISYSLEFNNGGFEHDLCEWTTSGDGRSIASLEGISPWEGGQMGLISTGLGKSTSSGTIKQTFVVANESKITLKWNLLSEEFLEYIGSQYQDKFTISLVDRFGNEEIIYHNTIDGIAGEFGADSENPGNLASSSANLGEGGVYMTDWQFLEYSLENYENECITIKFYCEDVGDSAYDTAVLLDEIEIK